MSSRYLAALKENYNLIGLAATASAVMAIGSLPLLLAGVVAEAAYLIFVPDSKWYGAHLSRRDDALIEARREELKAKNLPLIRQPLQDRFARLEATRRGIDNQSTSDARWLREILRKLDFLLEKFLQFAVKEEQFCNYLAQARREVEASHPGLRAASKSAAPNNAPQNWLSESVALVQRAYEVDIARIEAECAAENSGETGESSSRPILQKRIEVLQRRREFIGKIGKIVVNLRHQLALLEDTFGLISDELLARPPEQVLADIDDVVSQTNAMTEVLEELAPYERMLSALGK